MDRGYQHRMMVRIIELQRRRKKFLRSQGFEKTDDQLTYTERGWPRPFIKGWPIPWVSPAEELKRTHPDRMTEIVDYALCQVCGMKPSPEESVFLLVNGELTDNPEGMDMSTKMVQAMDNAAMHFRCMKLAVGRCPELKRMLAEGKLYLFAAKYSDIKIYEVPDTESDRRKTVNVLGVDGEFAKYVRWEQISGKPFRI